MIRPIAVSALLVCLASCGGTNSNEAALQDAAEQSDPAAAAVLNESAENGMDPQQALNEAAQAQLSGIAEPNSTLQARPNLPDSPNRKDGTQPPDKVDVQQAPAQP